MNSLIMRALVAYCRGSAQKILHRGCQHVGTAEQWRPGPGMRAVDACVAEADRGSPDDPGVYEIPEDKITTVSEGSRQGMQTL